MNQQRTYLFEDVYVSYVINVPLGTINLSASYDYDFRFPRLREISSEMSRTVSYPYQGLPQDEPI